MDVYIGDKPESEEVFIVNQVDAETQKFDEHKVMIGFEDQKQAEETYDAGFSDKKGPQRRSSIRPMMMGEFKNRLEKGDTTKPANSKAMKKQAQEGKISSQQFMELEQKRIENERKDPKVIKKIKERSAAEKLKREEKVAEEKRARSDLLLAGKVAKSMPGISVQKSTDRNGKLSTYYFYNDRTNQKIRVSDHDIPETDLRSRSARGGFFDGGAHIYASGSKDLRDADWWRNAIAEELRLDPISEVDVTEQEKPVKSEEKAPLPEKVAEKELKVAEKELPAETDQAAPVAKEAEEKKAVPSAKKPIKKQAEKKQWEMQETEQVLLDQGQFTLPHPPRDKEKFNALVNDMVENGWKGRPVLTIDQGGQTNALTGSHRLAAAEIAEWGNNLEELNPNFDDRARAINVPTVEIEGLKKKQINRVLAAQYDDAALLGALSELQDEGVKGLDEAVNLMRQEISGNDTKPVQKAEPKEAEKKASPVTKKPIKKRKAKPKQPQEEDIAKYFKPGRVVKSYFGHDKVISFNKGDSVSRWSVRVQSVKWDSESKEWVGDGSSPRTHGTSPSMKELVAQESQTGDISQKMKERVSKNAFSRRKGPSGKKSMTFDQVEKAVNSLTRRWQADQLPGIQVVSTYADLPSGLRTEAQTAFGEDVE